MKLGEGPALRLLFDERATLALGSEVVDPELVQEVWLEEYLVSLRSRASPRSRRPVRFMSLPIAPRFTERGPHRAPFSKAIWMWPAISLRQRMSGWSTARRLAVRGICGSPTRSMTRSWIRR